MNLSVWIAKAAIGLGLAVMLLALAWWFAYYSQWQGPFDLLDVKAGCLFLKTSECRTFQQFIGASRVPVYQPGMLLGGAMMVFFAFVMLKRRA